MTTTELEKQIFDILSKTFYFMDHDRIRCAKEIASLIEQQKPKETDLKYRCNHCGFEWTHQDDYCPNCGEDNFDEVIEQQQSESGTAEEILAKLIYPETTTDWIKDAKDMGIPVFMALKAMESYAKQQCQKQLREELIKFAQSGMTYPSYTENGARIIVDEYLKQKGLPL